MKTKYTSLMMSLLLFGSHSLIADELQQFRAASPDNRVAMLELYTSEGCSSCPPADRFLSGLKATGIDSSQLIPLAFHVTYWDYIGWKDPYADSRYDDRQRDIGRHNNSRTIYTPQFVLNGRDYRNYSRFSKDVNTIIDEPARVKLELSAAITPDGVADVALTTNIEHSPVDDVAFYVAVYEQNLSSDVTDGENEGELLKHDYVVRELKGPFIQGKPKTTDNHQQRFALAQNWKQHDLGLVAFAQNPHTGEILQAVQLKFANQ